jgi:hypothetical protein
MTTKRSNGRLAQQGTSALTLLLSDEDRRILNVLVRYTNDLLSTRVSQASIIRRAMRVYDDYLMNVMGKFALGGDVDGINGFLRTEKADLYRVNNIKPDGVDPAKEYAIKSEVAAREAFAATKDMSPEQVWEYIRTPKGGDV